MQSGRIWISLLGDPAWALDGGGALMNQAIHSVDLLSWIMGPVVEIRAQTATLAHERIAVEDTAIATLPRSPGSVMMPASFTTVPWVPVLCATRVPGGSRPRR